MMNMIYACGQLFRNPAADNVPGCLAVASLLQWTIVSLFFIAASTAVSMVFVREGSDCGDKIYNKCKSAISILSLIGPYLLAGIVLMINLSVVRSYGLGYLAGGLVSPRSYLEMRTLADGNTLCFIQGDSFNYSITLIYALVMAVIVGSFGYLLIKKKSAAKDLKKMSIVLFIIGLCWLFLVLVGSGVQGVGLYYMFAILRGAQSIALLVVYFLAAETKFTGDTLKSCFNPRFRKFKLPKF